MANFRYSTAHMADIGKRNKLPVLHEAPPGLYLDGGERGEILLPRRYIPATGAVPGDVFDVFVYLDSEDRLVATTEKPLAMVGEFACLKVLSVNNRVGAFLDWGLSKDLLLPFREQLKPVAPNESVVAYVYLDSESSRIVATTRISRHLNQQPPPYRLGQPVRLLITGRSPRCYNAIVENAHRGLLYQNEVPTQLVTGQQLTAYVRKYRTDGWIELSLGATRAKTVAPLTVQILRLLQSNAGRLAFDDSTPPAQIQEHFGVSKNAFKQALATLYRQRRICFTKPGIALVKHTGGGRR